jgi:hypothetical protein
MILKLKGRNLNNAAWAQEKSNHEIRGFCVLNSRSCSPSHSLNALMQGVLNIHALIEGHTRFETKNPRLKQTINLCFRKNIHCIVLK